MAQTAALLKPRISIPVSSNICWNLPGWFLWGRFLGGLPGSLLLRAAAVRLRFGLGFTLAGPGLLARVVLSIGMGAERNAPHGAMAGMSWVTDKASPRYGSGTMQLPRMTNVSGGSPIGMRQTTAPLRLDAMRLMESALHGAVLRCLS